MDDEVNNITIVVPEPQPEPITETSYEEIGEQLLTRLDILDQRNEELANALTACLERIIILEGREYATIEHIHEGLADAEHTHDGYAATDHTHQEHKREKDKEPENQHPYFRRVPDRG